ncbi:conserved hypothetical protein [Vibrio harveyi]|nr:conserved hypothetical protein [Vibrio harveyi]CAH1572697.1 conserved hypothetical protein [Vibrio harveyi]CAH1586174.1 conserved hypothetical protein [Vibrio harveyi]CAK6716065.1 conserved hypothetical protein [Vibrio harveyi]
MIFTLEDPEEILSGGPTQISLSPFRAAGRPVIFTFGDPIMTGPPT